MENRLVLCLLAFIACCHAFGRPGAYKGYQVFTIIPSNLEQVKYVFDLSNDESYNLDFWRDARKVGQTARFMVHPKHTESLKAQLNKDGIKFEIAIDDVDRVVAEDKERVVASRNKVKAAGAAFDYNIYHTYEEIMAEMEEMVSRCPSGFMCETYSIGTSYEGRDMKVFRIWKNEPGRTAHWYDSAIHAREWLSPATHLKIVNHYLTNYHTDAEAKEFLDQGDHYHLFIHNPDGYKWTWTDSRLWRKNRYNNTLNRPGENPNDCMGIDLNRNYMHRWGNAGNSWSPCSNTYRGLHPASEVETQNVQNEIRRIKALQEIETYMCIHTAARMILSPWGSVMDPGTQEECEFTEDWEHKEVMEVLRLMERAIEGTHGYHNWDVGNSCDTIYPASGLGQDFGRAIGGALFSFTPELRDMDHQMNDYGFQAPPTEIHPSFQEMWNGFLTMYRGVNHFKAKMEKMPNHPYHLWKMTQMYN